MKNLFGVFLFLTASCSGSDREEIKVDLNTVYNQPESGFLILRPVSEMEDGISEKIVYPDLSQITDTAFAQLYYTGKNQSAVNNGILVLVGDVQSASPLIWVDGNNDLDFSGSEQPLHFSQSFIDISMSEPDNPRLKHTLRVHKPDTAKKQNIKGMIEQYITKGKPYTDFYMLRRRNIRVGDFVYKGDSIRIGMMDWNVNGAYHDTGTDRLVIGTYGGEITGTDEASGAVILDTATYFQAGTHHFEVVHVADDGTSISVRTASADNVMTHLKAGSAIPDYRIELLSGKESSIYEYLGEETYLLLNFWASWCAGCHQEVEELQNIHSEYPDQVKLISLNYNERADKVRSFIQKYSITWLNGSSTTEINDGLRVSGLPRNVLVDPAGEIIDMNVRPSRLIERIEQLESR